LLPSEIKSTSQFFAARTEIPEAAEFEIARNLKRMGTSYFFWIVGSDKGTKNQLKS
jgi:hypothetical protein